MIVDPVPAYRFLTDKPLGSYRYRAAYGGRGGAKSWEFVDAVLVHALENPKLRVAFVREIQATLEESSIQLVRSRIEYHGLAGYFREVKNTFIGRHGQKIMFIGLWKGNKPSGIKSLEGVHLTIAEEAQEMRQVSLDVLFPTVMRTGKSEIWALWNPNLETDPVDKFFRGPIKPKGAIVRRINWDKNPHFPVALREQMETDRAKDPERAAHIWDGKYTPGVQNSIWSRKTIDAAWRKGLLYRSATFERIVIGVDPAGGGDDVGIVVVGQIGDSAVVLEDGTMPSKEPLAWATKINQLAEKWDADCVVVERNYGGALVEANLRAGGVQVRVVEGNATRGKHVRAEPIASLYDQGRVAHIKPFPEMESEMLMTTPAGYEGTFSPNRMDALVWAITELNLADSPQAFMLLKRTG